MLGLLLVQPHQQGSRSSDFGLSAAALFAASLVVFSRLGQEFTPTLDENNIVMEVKRACRARRRPTLRPFSSKSRR
ncbi:hypothetical protein [Bradyrhizobium sp. CCBAU 51753]|uniref:hypothetical protein n=1 Tax=Bradyrhizobium sp. CCBAU 51753 TaxID=1325100 RepID=UPI00188D2B02|nr:hypothetical protein [Bradyrhizobium sp. CCBAU 51753]